MAAPFCVIPSCRLDVLLISNSSVGADRQSTVSLPEDQGHEAVFLRIYLSGPLERNRRRKAGLISVAGSQWRATYSWKLLLSHSWPKKVSSSCN